MKSIVVIGTILSCLAWTQAHHEHNYVIYKDPRVTTAVREKFTNYDVYEKCQKNTKSNLGTCLTGVIGADLAESIVTDTFDTDNFDTLIKRSCAHPTGVIPCLKTDLEETKPCLTQHGVTNPVTTPDKLKAIEIFITGNCNKVEQQQFNPYRFGHCGAAMKPAIARCLKRFDGAMRGLYGKELKKLFYTDDIACHGLEHYSECIEEAYATCGDNSDQHKERFVTEFNKVLTALGCGSDIERPPFNNAFEERFFQIKELGICDGLKTTTELTDENPTCKTLTTSLSTFWPDFWKKAHDNQLTSFFDDYCPKLPQMEKCMDERLTSAHNCIHREDKFFNDKGLRAAKAFFHKVCLNHGAEFSKLASPTGSQCYRDNAAKFDHCFHTLKDAATAKIGNFANFYYYDAEVKTDTSEFVTCIEEIYEKSCHLTDLKNVVTDISSAVTSIDTTDTTPTVPLIPDDHHHHHHGGHGHGHDHDHDHDHDHSHDHAHNHHHH